MTLIQLRLKKTLQYGSKYSYGFENDHKLQQAFTSKERASHYITHPWWSCSRELWDRKRQQRSDAFQWEPLPPLIESTAVNCYLDGATEGRFYETRSTNQELWITNYESRITKDELRIMNHGSRLEENEKHPWGSERWRRPRCFEEDRDLHSNYWEVVKTCPTRHNSRQVTTTGQTLNTLQ